jgi:protein associated with RNAse G/E
MKATILNIRSVISAIKKLDINISDYDTPTEIERQINVNKFDLLLEIRVFPDKTIDTSDFDYFDGTGNSCDIIESGYAEIKNIDAYFNDEQIGLSKSNLDSIYKEFNKCYGNES